MRAGLAKFKQFGKGRKVPGEMNKTEQRFEDQKLIPWLRLGKVQAYGYEAITFKLAPDTRYTPDFWAMAGDGAIDFYECKGSFELDANGKTKFKVAAAMFPFRFHFCKWMGNAEGWQIVSAYDEPASPALRDGAGHNGRDE